MYFWVRTNYFMKNNYFTQVQHSLIITLLVVFFVLRLIPYIPNFNPILALAIVVGASRQKLVKTSLIFIGLSFFTDFIVNNFYYSSMYSGVMFFDMYQLWNTISILLIIFLSYKFQNFKSQSVFFASQGIVASAIFFVISNFGTWISTNMYSKSFDGLLKCYTMAIPFFSSTLVSTLVYSFIFYFTLKYIFSKFTLQKIK